jgi:alcohol dehydrogenase class IV
MTMAASNGSMRPFVYDALPGRVLFGPGEFSKAAIELDRLGARRIVLIADRSGASWADRLAGTLGARIVARIDDVIPHVPIEAAKAARGLASDTRADAIVTLGGGSSTGLGKAIAMVIPIPILAIPTTYAGSEMTPIWGLTQQGRKDTGRDPNVQPKTVVYDPLLTLSLPPGVAGPSGMNALAHCIEATYGDGANPVITLLALEGIRILSTSLPAVVAAPENLDARTDALAGAYLAGASFAAAGSGIHHKICHVLGGVYDLPHAETHTVVLPHSVAFMTSREPAAIARVGAAMGTADVAGGVYELVVRIGAPTDLASIGMPANRLDEAANLIVEAARGGSVDVTPATMRALLDDAYAGRRPTVPATLATSDPIAPPITA